MANKCNEINKLLLYTVIINYLVITLSYTIFLIGLNYTCVVVSSRQTNLRKGAAGNVLHSLLPECVSFLYVRSSVVITYAWCSMYKPGLNKLIQKVPCNLEHILNMRWLSSVLVRFLTHSFPSSSLTAAAVSRWFCVKWDTLYFCQIQYKHLFFLIQNASFNLYKLFFCCSDYTDPSESKNHKRFFPYAG